jgi:carboxypeptidase T
MRKFWRAPLLALGATVSLVGCSMNAPIGALGDRANGPLAAQGQGQGQEVHITFKDGAQLDNLARHGVDLFENVDNQHHTVDALVTPRGESYLRQMGVRYTVTLNSPNFANGFPQGYQTVAGLTADLQALAVAHPNTVKLTIIGQSLEKRPLYAVEICSHPEAHLPAVRINSGQHARELPPVEITSRLIHLLAEGYGTNPAITQLVDTRDIWIIPLVNPDGRSRVEKGSNMWRKNARPNGDGTWGVDTNRNADDHFAQGDKDSSQDDYQGKAPFSEPESQAIRDLCAKEHFTVSLDLHNYAGMVLWAPGYSNALTKDDAAFSRIGGQLASHIGYKFGTINRTIYPTYGDLSTWEYDAYGTLGFAAELNDTGFNPPYSEVAKDWSDWQANLLYLISVADNPRLAHAPLGLSAYSKQLAF